MRPASVQPTSCATASAAMLSSALPARSRHFRQSSTASAISRMARCRSARRSGWARPHQFNLAPASPGSRRQPQPACPSAMAKRLQPDAGDPRGRRHHQHVERRHQRPLVIALRQAAQGDQSGLVAADVRAGRQVDLDGAPRAEQEGVHGDGEVGQHLDQARRLEAAMKRRALRPAAPGPAATGASPRARSAR